MAGKFRIEKLAELARVPAWTARRYVKCHGDAPRSRTWRLLDLVLADPKAVAVLLDDARANRRLKARREPAKLPPARVRCTVCGKVYGARWGVDLPSKRSRHAELVPLLPRHLDDVTGIRCRGSYKFGELVDPEPEEPAGIPPAKEKNDEPV